MFKGWMFDEETLIDPEGNRYTEFQIRAVFFLKQMRDFRDLLYTDHLMQDGGRRGDVSPSPSLAPPGGETESAEITGAYSN